MGVMESVRFVIGALRGHRLRSILSAIGIAIGVAAVTLLTSLGEGTRAYIVGQFTQFGTNIVAVNPGKVKTFGIPGVLGGTTNKLAINDAESLRRIPGVTSVVPVAFGQARVEAGNRGRSVYIYGVNHQLPKVWQVPVGQGSFLPEMDANRQSSLAVLGPKLAREVFGEIPPLGKRVRIGSASLLVIGVMSPKGQLLGFDIDDCAFIPVATAMNMFNQTELMEIDLTIRDAMAVPPAIAEIRRILTARHRGEEDFTITTQTEMLDTFGRVIGIITVAVSAIAGISLFVGAMGILTIMWISVHERTAEIGLLRALGVEKGRIQFLFLLEAALLALAGGALGIGFSLSVEYLLALAVPGLPMKTPAIIVMAALVMSAVVGIAAGVVPARRAAGLDPIDALRAE